VDNRYLTGAKRRQHVSRLGCSVVGQSHERPGRTGSYTGRPRRRESARMGGQRRGDRSRRLPV